MTNPLRSPFHRRAVARRLKWWLPIQVLAIVLFTVVALTASNAVPSSRASNSANASTADQKKPASCNAIALTTVLAGNGIINGTNANELVVGGAGVDTIDGAAGNDCIVGGGGNDALRGSQGTDVCIGGPGTDTFHNTCETQIQ